MLESAKAAIRNQSSQRVFINDLQVGNCAYFLLTAPPPKGTRRFGVWAELGPELGSGHDFIWTRWQYELHTFFLIGFHRSGKVQRGELNGFRPIPILPVIAAGIQNP